MIEKTKTLSDGAEMALQHHPKKVHYNVFIFIFWFFLGYFSTTIRQHASSNVNLCGLWE